MNGIRQHKRLQSLLRAMQRSTRSGMPYKKRKKREENDVMLYERLVRWAAEYWEAHYPDVEPRSIWASVECSNKIAQDQIKPGRRVQGKYRYGGFDEVATDLIVPISDYTRRGTRMMLTATSGAYVFHFEHAITGETFDVIYASSYFDDDVQDLTAIALVPEDKLAVWVKFEALCAKTVRPRIQRRRDVYIIGGTEAYFAPTVEWRDVVLPPDLKSDIYDDVEAFFSKGVDIYRQLKLAPFRKLLLAGVPGTGKTMLCAALAKHAIDQKRIVVYVSGSDRDGATFEKIQRAFQAVANAKYPTLLIVEEIDAYLRGDDKARILNVLDGIESPNNPKGTLMVATTNYPDAIDDRIFKRPGRLDRIFMVPTLQEESLAEQMLRHYMSDQWQDEHREVVPGLLNQPGAFVREVALHARMLAAHDHQTQVTLSMLQESVASLVRQMKLDRDFIADRRPLGLRIEKRRSTNHRTTLE